jgi:hypothetical protein
MLESKVIISKIKHVLANETSLIHEMVDSDTDILLDLKEEDWPSVEIEKRGLEGVVEETNEVWTDLDQIVLESLLLEPVQTLAEVGFKEDVEIIEGDDGYKMPWDQRILDSLRLGPVQSLVKLSLKEDVAIIEEDDKDIEMASSLERVVDSLPLELAKVAFNDDVEIIDEDVDIEMGIPPVVSRGINPQHVSSDIQPRLNLRVASPGQQQTPRRRGRFSGRRRRTPRNSYPRRTRELMILFFLV